MPRKNINVHYRVKNVYVHCRVKMSLLSSSAIPRVFCPPKNRTFKMKVTQIECGAVNRAFEGCLQYYHEVK